MKPIAFLLLLVIIIIGIPNDAAAQTVGDDFFDTDPTQAVSEATGTTATGVSNALPRPGGGAIVESAESITTASGQRLENVHGAELDGQGRLIKAGSLEYSGGLFTHVEGFEALADGSYAIERAGRIIHKGNLLTDAVGVRFADDVLGAESVGSFARGRVIAGRLGGLIADDLSFFVDHAESLLSGCIFVGNVSATQVTSHADGLTLEPLDDEPIAVRDCDFNELQFSGAELRIAASVPASYNVIGGTLLYKSNGSREQVYSNTSAVVEMDGQHGIACAAIEPPGTYWYNANDIRQDFGIHVPPDGSRFRLCIRKHPDQRFLQYDGLADLVDRQVVLSEAVQFLKYPFHSGQPLSLLMDLLYANEPGFNATLTVRRGSGLIGTVAIGGGPASEHSTASTMPNDFYEFRETAIDEETHRLMRIDFRASPGTRAQSRVSHYLTDYFRPELTFENEVATQTNDHGTIRVLPPGHTEIKEIVT